MASLWIRRIGTIAIATAVIGAALALLWAVWWLWPRLAPQLDPWTIIAIVIVALALLAAIWWVWWRLPERQAARLRLWETKARADVEDNFRKTVGQALGGAAVLIGGVAAYLQFTQQQAATQAQLRAGHDLLISNQSSKGFEQLAGEKMTMRLGGIYALEGVMNTSEQYHQPVLEALCAFVREGATPAADVQAALTVIGRRSAGIGQVNLAAANLRGAYLVGASLIGADMRGARLSEADMGHVKLNGANLRSADLRGANLTYANLTFANLSEADLRSADLRITNLSGADLHSADLSGAYLGAFLEPGILRDYHIEFSHADLSAKGAAVS